MERWGYIDTWGREIIECKFAWTGTFSEGFAPAGLSDGTRVLIDSLGKTVLSGSFNYVSPPTNGRVIVGRDGAYGIYSVDGKELFPITYRRIMDVGAGRLMVNCDGNGYQMTLNDGMPISPHRWSNVSGRGFSCGLVEVSKSDATSCYLDLTGEPVLGPFKFANSFSEGFAFVVTGEGNFIIDTHGERIFPLFQIRMFGGFSSGVAVLYGPDGWGLFPVDLEVKWIPGCTELGPLSEGLASARFGDKVGAVDCFGKIAIEPIYESAKDLQDGMLPVQKDGLWGAVDRTGKHVEVPFRYNRLGAFSEGKAAVCLDVPNSQ